MAGGCQAGAGISPVPDLIAIADCHAALLGDGGWHALGQIALFAPLVTGLLTLAVAVQGYRMLFGLLPDTGRAVGMMVRIGIAIALAGSWQAYGTLVYGVATRGPVEIGAVLTGAAGLDTSDLPGRLEHSYMMLRLDPETRGRMTAETAATPAPTSIAAGAGDGGQRTAAILLVVASIGPWIALRLAIALLLALGPLMAMALLFDATTGLFFGWLKTLAGAIVGLAGIAVVIPLELEAIEPVLAAADTGTPDYTAVTAILAVFALVAGAMLFAANRATGLLFAMPRSGRSRPGRPDARFATASAGTAVAPPGSWRAPAAAAPAAFVVASRSSAARVSDALDAAVRRDAARSGSGGHAMFAVAAPGIAGGAAPRLADPAVALSGRRALPIPKSSPNRSGRP